MHKRSQEMKIRIWFRMKTGETITTKGRIGCRPLIRQVEILFSDQQSISGVEQSDYFPLK